MNKKIFLLAIIISISIAGCGVRFSIPQITPGPVVQEKIEASVPSGTVGSTRLLLSFWCGRITHQTWF